MENEQSSIMKVVCGVSVSVIAGLVLAMIVMLGTVRVNEAAIMRTERSTLRNRDDISALLADTQEIKAIVQRMEKRLESQ